MLPARKRSTIAAVWWWVSRVSCATGGTSAAVVSASRLPSASLPSLFPHGFLAGSPFPRKVKIRLLRHAHCGGLALMMRRMPLHLALDALCDRVPSYQIYWSLSRLSRWLPGGGGAPGRCAGHSRSPSRARARLPPTERHACIEQPGRGAAPCGSWGWTVQSCSDRLTRSTGVRCTVDTSHTTPRSQGREQSGKSPV